MNTKTWKWKPNGKEKSGKSREYEPKPPKIPVSPFGKGRQSLVLP